MTNVYGNNGNRWWFGYNRNQGIDQSIAANVLNNPSGYESMPSGNAADDAKFAADAKLVAASSNRTSGEGPVVIVEGVPWANVHGPYTTQAKANAALAAYQKTAPASSDVSQALQNAPLSWEQAIVKFLGELESSATWVRAAKILIGGTLVVVGLFRMTGADKVVETAAKAAVL